jgi:hypothetical protein
LAVELNARESSRPGAGFLFSIVDRRPFKRPLNDRFARAAGRLSWSPFVSL